jgi:hypothetical protein
MRETLVSQPADRKEELVQSGDLYATDRSVVEARIARN